MKKRILGLTLCLCLAMTVVTGETILEGNFFDDVMLNPVTAEEVTGEDSYAIVAVDGYEEKNAAVAAMLERYADDVITGDEEVPDDGSVARVGLVLAKVEGDLPELAEFDVLEIIADDDGRYYIQTISADAAEACAAYLMGLDNVVYAERDQMVFAADDSGNDVDFEGSNIKDFFPGSLTASEWPSRHWGGDFPMFTEAQQAAAGNALPVYAAARSWGVSVVGADAYAARTRSNNVQDDEIIVAVLDSGVEATHPFLKNHLVNGYDYIENDTVPQDGHGHGTHVSGTVVDCASGMKIKVMPVRVLGNDNKGWADQCAEGIRYAVDHGAHVVNMSIYGKGASYDVEDAIRYAETKNVPVVVCAGNDNKDTAGYWPAQYGKCITVAALQSRTGRWSGSNYGAAVDVAAPGVNINSSMINHSYASWTGTSMATPHVTAAAAMLLYNFPSYTVAEVEATIRNNATDLGAAGWDQFFGAGCLNMAGFPVRAANVFRLNYDTNGGNEIFPFKYITKGQNYGDLPIPTRDHYTFAGWYTSRSGGTKILSATTVNVTDNQTLYAHWTAKSYTVTLNSNGGEAVDPATLTVTYGGTYGKLPTPTRAGYRFSGWYTAQSGGIRVTGNTKVTIIANQTLYALWTAKSYTVTLNSNGGETVDPATLTVTYGGTYWKLLTPKRTGYRFDGWYTAQSGGTQVTWTTKVTIAANHTLYAHWTANTYTVTFHANGGNEVDPASVKVTYNKTYGKLPTVTRDGYRFDGWYTAQSGGTQVTETMKVTITANQTLYAHWTAHSYTVTFKANGDGLVDPASMKVTYDKTYGKLPTLTRDGCRFDGWYTAQSGGTQVTETTKVTITADQTLYARWTANTYTVTLDSNGGNAVDPASLTVTYDGIYGTLPTPVRTGYRFDGWYTAQSGGSQVTETTQVTLTADQILYARWTANTYTVTLDSNGGNVVDPATMTVTYDETYGTLPTPVRTGYRFDGWFTARSGGTQVTETTQVTLTANQTLIACWTANTYTVVFEPYGDDVDVKKKDVVFGESYGELPRPTRKGYSFVGWYTDTVNGNAVTATSFVSTVGDHTLHARWEAEVYEVTFDLNGGEGFAASKMVRYNSAYGELPQPIRRGYAFAGWYTAAVGGNAVTETSLVSITGDHTLYARWKSCDWRDNCPSRQFTDVPGPDNWAHEGIDFVVNRGLFNGISAKEFAPSATMTRAMMVTVLWRLEGKPDANEACAFYDVPAGSYYEKAVAWAAQKNIVQGISTAEFLPAGDISRQQLATIIYRYAVFKGYVDTERADLNAFPDHAVIADYAETALSWAVAVGIVNGTDIGDVVLLDPEGNATRAQVAAIFKRFTTMILP